MRPFYESVMACFVCVVMMQPNHRPIQCGVSSRWGEP